MSKIHNLGISRLVRSAYTPLAWRLAQEGVAHEWLAQEGVAHEWLAQEGVAHERLS